jgi:poly(3-hydroxybutyrate) depolymerase
MKGIRILLFLMVATASAKIREAAHVHTKRLQERPKPLSFVSMKDLIKETNSSDFLSVGLTWDFSGSIVTPSRPTSLMNEETRLNRTHAYRHYYVVGPDKDAKASFLSDKPHSKSPAIIMLHGAYSDPKAFSMEGNMRESARAAGYSLAYLEATQDKDGYRMWNSGSYGDTADRDNVDDVSYIAAVVQELVANQSVDPDRVYLVGISNGGSMALRAACERADLFAGVAVAHGSLEFRRGEQCAEDCTEGTCSWAQGVNSCKESEWVQSLKPIYQCDALKKKPMPMLMVSGEAAPYASVDGSVEQPHSKNPLSYPPMKYMENYFAELYGCSKDRSVVFKNGTEESWTSCEGRPHGCAATLTMCRSSAGDWWYGDEYDIKTPCLAKGYRKADCEPSAQYQAWGETTDSLRLTPTILEFFSQQLIGKPVMRHY